MKIIIGTDHRGFAAKEYLKTVDTINNQAIEWIDVGAYDDKRSDYPLFAQHVCEMMEISMDIEHGILICGTGGGMAVAANRYKHIYAIVAWNQETAKLSVEYDKSNVLVIPADFVSEDDLLGIVSSWLQAKFRGGRYQERIAIIDSLTDSDSF